MMHTCSLLILAKIHIPTNFETFRLVGETGTSLYAWMNFIIKVIPICRQDQVYVDAMLPFGLCLAPKVFNAAADALEW